MDIKKLWYAAYSVAALVSLSVVLVVKFSNLVKSRNLAFDLVFLTNASEGDTTVVPLSAYYDARPQHSHKNSTVILASVLENKQVSIVGCEVDGAQRYKPMVSARPVSVSGWIQYNHHVTHIDIIVSCFDMYIDKNSTVNLLYQDEGNLFRVAVKNDVVMATQDSEQDGVMICSTGYGSDIP